MAKSASFRVAAAIFGITSLMKLSALAAALAILGSTAGHAGSLGRPCTAAPQSAWLPVDALQSKVESQGYSVRKAKLKNPCGEFYATDAAGARIELFVDPTTGTIVGRL